MSNRRHLCKVYNESTLISKVTYEIEQKTVSDKNIKICCLFLFMVKRNDQLCQNKFYKKIIENEFR